MAQYSSIIGTDADESIAVSTTAATLTLPAYLTVSAGRVNHGKATVQVRDAAILYTINGTAPTAADESTGIKLSVGDILVLTTLAEMNNLKMMRATGTDGAVFVEYQKRID